jgi:hypothetical protein
VVRDEPPRGHDAGGVAEGVGEVIISCIVLLVGLGMFAAAGIAVAGWRG